VITIADYVRFAAAAHPSRHAVVSLSQGRVVTYAELNDDSDRLAAAMLHRGLAHGDRIACWLSTSVTYLELYLAAAKAGLVIVPINERLSVPEVRHIISDSGSRALFFQATLAEAVDALDTGSDLWLVSSDPVELSRATVVAEMYRATPAPHLASVSAQSPLVIAYTSGTTGQPKGAILSHSGIVAMNRSNAIAYRLPVRGVGVYGASMSFTGTVLGQILTLLYTGGTVVLVGESDPDLILHAIEEYRANFAAMPPPLIADFAEICARRGAALPDLCGLLQSGGKAPLDALASLNDLLQGRLVLAWGMTEISGGAAAATTKDDMLRALSGDHRLLASVGKAVPGYSVRTALAESAQEQPDLSQDDGSELLIATDSIMAGYWNRPDETDRAVREGWYHSGDLGVIDEEGFIFIKDRRTDLIVSGGANVYPSEVERVLLEVPGIRDCAIVGVPHPHWGQSVTAVVVADPGAGLTSGTVIDYCRGRIASYKKPTAVLFVEELPRTVGGKLQRYKIRELAMSLESGNG
jgi:fatty-acyl-CoA synthase